VNDLHEGREFEKNSANQGDNSQIQTKLAVFNVRSNTGESDTIEETQGRLVIISVFTKHLIHYFYLYSL
jgi:hypothetical protein